MTIPTTEAMFQPSFVTNCGLGGERCGEKRVAVFPASEELASNDIMVPQPFANYSVIVSFFIWNYAACSYDPTNYSVIQDLYASRRAVVVSGHVP